MRTDNYLPLRGRDYACAFGSEGIRDDFRNELKYGVPMSDEYLYFMVDGNVRKELSYTVGIAEQ